MPPRVPLGYCTNVHPAETLAEAWTALRLHAPRLRQRLKGPVGIGLYLPWAVAEPLASRPESAESFRDFLASAGLEVFTANAFPIGGFHARRVKEAVYRPDWTTPRRVDFSILAGSALAALLPEGATGTVSTLPVGWKGDSLDSVALERAAANLLAVAEVFRQVREESGKTLVLCLEPEPMCVLETSEETAAFFERCLLTAGKALTRHLGVCLDPCHMALAFEEPAAAVRRLAPLGIAKVQISSALSVKDPARHPEAVDALKTFAEERYLHQLACRTPAGVQRLQDLDLLDPEAEPWRTASEWRCHFHVPVDRESFGPLGTTRDWIEKAIPELLKLPETPQFEVETYTWGVLPEAERPTDADSLAEGLAREMLWARKALGMKGETA